MRGLALLLLLGCPCRRGPETVDVVEITEDPPAEAARPPAGEVVDGRFVDARLGFSVPVAEGWTVQAGEDPFPLRAVFTDEVTGARVEVWSYTEDSLSVRPRAGCDWVFQDTGAYEALRVREPLTVASCRPDDPRAPKIMGVYLLRDGQAWHLEAVYPEGALAPGRERTQELLWGMRFE